MNKYAKDRALEPAVECLDSLSGGKSYPAH